MEEEYQERSVFMRGVAKVLNVGGNAAVFTYAATAGALKKGVKLVQKAPALPKKAVGVFSKGLGAVKPREVKEVEARINKHEIKIKTLYFEIGKEGAKYSDDENPLETEEVQKLIAVVREYEQEVQRLKNRVTEIKEQKKIEKKKKRAKVVRFAKKPSKATVKQVEKKVEAAIDKAVKQGEFESRSDWAIFSKVALDLLDNDIEIKILATEELGKIKNNAAIPILRECLHFSDSDLDIEIINTLIAIGDSRAIPVFKEKVSDARFRIRIECLRGLYKMADDQEAIPFLKEALRDKNAEVRQAAITFIGWKDYDDIVPALVQCLWDEEAGVRKAAVSALANLKDESSVLPLIRALADENFEIRQKALEAVQDISGKEITFDVNASGKQLREGVNSIREWWQKERLGKTDVEAQEEVAEPDMATEEVAEVETETVEEDVSEPETTAEEVAKAETVTAKKVAEQETVTEKDAEAQTVAPEETARTEEESPPEEAALTASELNKMSRTELIAICQERGLEFNENQPKTEIIQVIIEG